MELRVHQLPRVSKFEQAKKPRACFTSEFPYGFDLDDLDWETLERHDMVDGSKGVV